VFIRKLRPKLIHEIGPQENRSCKYGEKCQFAHGSFELRAVNRHPKYKTDLCRTYHSVGFCPYGPRCHFIHSPDEATGASRKRFYESPVRPKTFLNKFLSSFWTNLNPSKIIRKFI
jgi:hypothetical protein